MNMLNLSYPNEKQDLFYIKDTDLFEAAMNYWQKKENKK